MRLLFCAYCERRVAAEADHTDGRPNDTYSCLECGDPIECDGCGQEWSDDHTCAGAILD